MTARVGARKAVILAAGAGRRLGLFSERHPKPLLPIHGVSILENCLARLADCGVEETVIVVGHLRDQIMAAAGDRHGAMRVRYVVAEDYATTNNIASLWCARGELDQDVLLLEADVFFDGALLAALQNTEADNVAAVSRFLPGMNGAVVALDEQGWILRMIEGKEQGAGFDYSHSYKTVNFYRLGAAYLKTMVVPALERAIAEGRTGEYYESLFKADIAAVPQLFRACDCSALNWYEIDDHEDKRAAEYMFLPHAAKRTFIAGQSGGAWRYGITDHSHIANPHFPPPDMLRRMMENFASVARHYPASQRELAQFASDAFGFAPEEVVIANGGAELIRILCRTLGKRIILPAPSFQGYENATPADRVMRFALPAPGFALDIDAFAKAAAEARAELAVVVSPNNPTALAVPAADLLRLARALETSGTLLVVDESFVDFCDGEEYRSLESSLAEHPNLAILKSLSKAHGVAGLRLAYLATQNRDLAQSVRAALPFQNVNALAESFLRWLPRYRVEFRASAAKVRAERDALYEDLRSLAGGHAYKSQANFVFWRLPEGIGADALASRLIQDHHILIKPCAGNHVRIASRTAEENHTLIAALRQILER